MLYGIEIRNPSGALLIDGRRPLPRLSEQRTVNIAAGAGNGPGVVGTVMFNTPLADPPFVLYHASTAVLAVTGILSSGGLFTGFNYVVPIYQGSMPVDFYVFDTGCWPAPTESHGIEIRDDAGGIVYHSGGRTLELIDSGVFPASMATQIDNWVNIETIPGDQTPLLWVGNPGAHQGFGSIPGIYPGLYLRHFMGRFQKDGSGRWYRWLVQIHVWQNFWPRNSGWGNVTLPWAVFTL